MNNLIGPLTGSCIVKKATEDIVFNGRGGLLYSSHHTFIITVTVKKGQIFSTSISFALLIYNDIDEWGPTFSRTTT